MARSGLGAPARLQLPPPRAGGGARPHFPAHPARGENGEAFLDKFKGSPSEHPASKARHQTPTSGRNRRSRTRVSPPFRLGGGRRAERAPGGAGGRLHGLPSRRAHRPRPRRPRRPSLQLPEAEQSSGPAGGQGREPGPAPRAVRYAPFRPLAASSRPQPPLGRGSHLRSPAPARERCAPTWGDSPGRSAAEPGLCGGGRRRHHLRRALHRDAAEARGALDPTPAAAPAAATWKRGGGAGAPRAAAAAASGAAAHDSVTGGIRQSVTWTPGPCRRCCSGANRSRRAPRLARPQPMGRARASM